MEDMKMAVVQPHGGTQLTAAATAGPATLVLRKIKWCLRDKWHISVQLLVFFHNGNCICSTGD